MSPRDVITVLCSGQEYDRGNIVSSPIHCFGRHVEAVCPVVGDVDSGQRWLLPLYKVSMFPSEMEKKCV